MTTRKSVIANWSVFDGFTRPRQRHTWAAAERWISEIEGQLGTEREPLVQRRRQADALLFDLGGDPTSRDWTSFRPLRREREEDWSDWLGQLIEDSGTGRFAWNLLGALEHRGPETYIARAVHREISHEGYRADLVIEWRDETYTHIEVKVGDPNLAKTYETACNMGVRFGEGKRRSDAVLLLRSQRDAWTSECRRVGEMGTRVQPLYWNDVTRALRAALPASVKEPIGWRVWAHAFCGAIEQDLLYIRPGRDADSWARQLNFSALAAAVELFANVETQ